MEDRDNLLGNDANYATLDDGLKCQFVAEQKPDTGSEAVCIAEADADMCAIDGVSVSPVVSPTTAPIAPSSARCVSESYSLFKVAFLATCIPFILL